MTRTKAKRIESPLTLALAFALLVGSATIFLSSQHASAVIVDGKRTGPSAIKDQSHEEDMIDGYNTRTCGMSDPDMTESNFVNAAREGQFPWLVSFQIGRPNGKHAHFCMGSFISDRWILSAAHCFAEPQLRSFLSSGSVRVTGGSTFVHGPNNANFTIKRIFYHSRFDLEHPIGFDVALVEIKEKAEIRPTYGGKLPYINTVCLPIEGKEFQEGQAVQIAGWGDTESKDPLSKPDFLLTTDLQLTNAEKCAEIFNRKMKTVKQQYNNYKDFICADYHGTRDACQGDSGSSLLEYADGKAVAIGIVSYGLGCATKGAPGVYEKTSSLMPWIKDITQYQENATVQYTLLTPEEEEED